MADYFFPDHVKQATHRRVDGRCECAGCGSHAGKRCDTTYWAYYDAYYVPVNPAQPPEAHNCRMICKRCYRAAGTVG